MKAITFSLQTQQPILATSFQGDPNSDVSYSYIPGSMVRGGLIGRYLKRNQVPDDILSDEAVRRLFFNGRTRYLNAYLQSQEGKRTLPVLHSWFKEKGTELEPDGMTVYDFTLDRENELESPKSVGEYFWARERGVVRFYKERRRINIHNQRDRKLGRSVKGQGEIFRYDALDAGQTFQAVILCEETDIEVLQELLKPEDIWLGGSQSAGYGQIKILDVQLQKNDWTEVGIKLQERIERENLTITLVSDTILQNEWGQYIANPWLVKQAIEEKLNVQLQLPEEGGIYASSTLIGGFNRKWGLPLPQVPALTAGSVFVFESELTPEQIHLLESEGIGERRVEGFGRVAVNWLEEHETFQARAPESSSSRKQYPLSEESQALAAQMAETLLHQKLEQLLLDQVSRSQLRSNVSNDNQNGASDSKFDISNSQLSRLMLVARQALTEDNCELVRTLLNNLPSNALNQFQRTKIEESNQSLDRQIYEWLDTCNQWQNNPRFWISNPHTVQIAGVERGLSDQLAREYTLRLIMAVAKKAMKDKNK
jgi:CRISPR-associated protein Csx10